MEDLALRMEERVGHHQSEESPELIWRRRRGSPSAHLSFGMSVRHTGWVSCWPLGRWVWTSGELKAYSTRKAIVSVYTIWGRETGLDERGKIEKSTASGPWRSNIGDWGERGAATKLIPRKKIDEGGRKIRRILCPGTKRGNMCRGMRSHPWRRLCRSS